MSPLPVPVPVPVPDGCLIRARVRARARARFFQVLDYNLFVTKRLPISFLFSVS